MTKVVLTLTTIPPRFSGLHDCLVSLLGQSAQVDDIILYLPKDYRRFPGTYETPKVPEGVQIKHVDRDLGPATKVLPAVAEYAGTDTLILFCDDDKIYHTDWAAQLIERAKAQPDAAVAAVGLNVSHSSTYSWSHSKSPSAKFVQKDARYRAKRAASLGFWKPPHVQGSGYVDIFCGWAGCVIRPEFFVAEDFDIPDVLWTVDDVWLSGCLEKNGISIWLENLGKDLTATAGPNDVESHSLRKSVYKGFDRKDANSACVRYFREHHQIWGG
jgi:GT2 family glycosyltransferase